MPATRPTNAQPAHDSRTCLADFWPVFLQSARSMRQTSLAAGSKKEAGNLTVYDAGPARGSKCAIDQANFAVVQFFAFQDLHHSVARDAAGRGALGRRTMPLKIISAV